MEPNVTVEISGGVGEIKCEPRSYLPSDALLAGLIADCRTESDRCFNVFMNIQPDRRSEFERQGWQVSGLISNHFGVGQHAFRMCFTIAKSRDGNPLAWKRPTTF